MKVRYAVIGLGNIGKRHLEHIIQNPESEIIAICDIDNSKSRADIPFYDDYRALLKRDDIDVVNICTPNFLHAQHCVDVLNAGKHAIVEKPMALTESECKEMINAEKQNNRIIFAVKQNRYNPPVQNVKTALENGWLGEVFSIQVNCFWNRNKSYYQNSDWRGFKEKDGGCLFTQFSHFVDILYYLTGDVDVYAGVTQNATHDYIEIEDIGSFLLKSKKNNALINFNYTTSAFEQNMEGSITIFGTKGTVKIGGQYLNTIEYQNIENNKLPDINLSSKPNDYGTYRGSMSNHDKLIENVNDVILRNKKITTSSIEGKDVVSIIERMYASLGQ